MKYVISAPAGRIAAHIQLPASKSISNRVLMLAALAGRKGQVENLSDSDDTRVMIGALSSDKPMVDIGHAGSSMRFLTAYYALVKGQVELSGSARMKERPVGPLVEALRSLGADIRYLEKEACPPLLISGGGLSGGEVSIDGSVSSQFISALMMIAPLLSGGLRIQLEGTVVSPAYIRMTLALMEECGAGGSFDGRRISIPGGHYDFDRYRVEGDWSGASYWYEVAALHPGSSLYIPDLREGSLQGDAVLPALFSALGVETRFSDAGIQISSHPRHFEGRFRYDFISCPDLVQTMAACLCGLGIPFRFTGTQTLRVKETDRIAALIAELGKLGFGLTTDESGNCLAWDGRRTSSVQQPLIKTYHDHRMAMALAPLASLNGALEIDDPLVVSKSYPGFWDDLARAGYRVQEA